MASGPLKNIHGDTSQRSIASSKPRASFSTFCATKIYHSSDFFGLLVELDHVFGSKWVLNEFDQFRLSMRYSEVIWFKYSVLENDDLKNVLKEVATGAVYGRLIILIIIFPHSMVLVHWMK